LKPRYYVAALAYCCFIFWLSNQSMPPGSGFKIPHLDKMAHFVLFGGLAAVISVGLHRSGKPHPSWVYHVAPAMAVFTYGTIDECHQYFVPLRSPDVVDLIMDVSGAIAAQEFLRVWFRGGRWGALPQPDET